MYSSLLRLLYELSPLSLYNAYLSVLLFYLAWNSCCLICIWLHLLFLSAICLKYHLLSIHFKPMFVFRAEMSLLETAYSWVLRFNPPSRSVFQLVDPMHLHLGRLLTHSLTIAIHLLFSGRSIPPLSLSPCFSVISLWWFCVAFS